MFGMIMTFVTSRGSLRQSILTLEVMMIMSSLPNPTNPVIAQVLRQMVSDANFRAAFQSNPTVALADYEEELTEQETMRLIAAAQSLLALTQGIDEVDAAFFFYKSDAA